MGAGELAASGSAQLALTPLALGIVLFVVGFVVAFAVAAYVLGRRARPSAGAE